MLFNLLGKTLIENSIGALKHHIKKKEVVRNLEIDAAKEIQIEKIKQSGGSNLSEANVHGLQVTPASSLASGGSTMLDLPC